MKRICAAFLFLLASSAFGATVSLRDLAPGDEELLRKNLPQLFSKDAHLSTYDAAIRLLMEQGTYENVFVDKNSASSYEIIGKPIRRIEKIEFSGVSQVDEAELRELVEFKTGDRFDRKRAVAAGEKVKNYYGEHGYFNTVIEMSFDRLPTKNIQVVYKILEKEPCLIWGLDFKTVNTDLKAKLDAYFRNLKKRPLTMDRARRLNNDLNDFLIGARYLTSEISGPEASYNADKTRAYLTFEVREPWRWEFYMDGNTFMSESDLYHALDLRNRERKNVDPPGEGAERLRHAYLEKGYPGVQIETEVVNPEGTYLKRVYYHIREGVRVRIQDIGVEGRISRAPAYYKHFIYQNSSELVARGYYNRLDLENGFKNLVTELRNQGYLRARVLSSRVEFNTKRDAASIFLLLEEGPQTRIRTLDFEGNKFISNYELARVTELETNTPLHLNSFEDSLDRLKTFYRNQGFLEMKLLNENEDLIQYNDKGTEARILFRIYEGPRIRVHSIAVEGNTITQSRVILKETNFTVGEVLTPSKIDGAIARLNRMGLFSRVDIHTLEEGTNVSSRTLVITVEDRDPGVVRIGAGVTDERNLTIRAFTGLSYSNLWGSGRGLSVRAEVKENVAQINYPEHQITAGYLEPFLFNTRTRGRVNLTRSEYVFYYGGSQGLTNLTTSNRIDLLAERDLAAHTKLTWKLWSLSSSKDWERHHRCEKDPTTTCAPDILQVATMGPTLDFDYRDSPFLPTKGSFTRMVVDYASPSYGSSRGIRFVRAEGNYTHYYRLGSPQFIWANSVRGGYVSNLDRDPGSGVPANYAFLLGGVNTVRGFDLADVNERIPAQGTGANLSNDNQGFQLVRSNERLVTRDSHYYLFKSEMRFPIYGEHGGVLFYDGGAVLITGYSFGRPYRDSIGLGYRYNTPVGPLALDLAFKIAPEKGESPFRFHLSIGTF